MTRLFKKFNLFILSALFISGCATQKPYDYTLFKQSSPHSILVLPPVNNSPDIKATASFFSHVTYPLAESGYYVFPVTLVDETFKQNGLTTSADIHALPPQKLQEIFGADSALYITITQYGSSYTIFDSAAIVTATAKLVDLRNSNLLWEGAATASSSEGQNGSGGIAVMLVAAIVKQIANNVTDASHRVAGTTAHRLLFAGHNNGILYGPRSPLYGKN